MFGESEPETVRRPASAPAASTSGGGPLRTPNNKKSNTKDNNGKLMKKKKSSSSKESSSSNTKKDVGGSSAAREAAAGGSPVLKRCNAKRDQVGHGPIRMNGISRPNVLSVQSSLNYNTIGKVATTIFMSANT